MPAVGEPTKNPILKQMEEKFNALLKEKNNVIELITNKVRCLYPIQSLIDTSVPCAEEKRPECFITSLEDILVAQQRELDDLNNILFTLDKVI